MDEPAARSKSRTTVPVLAVRDAVHFPLLVNTLHVAREPSVRAVRKCMEGDHRVLVLSQRDMSVEDPAVTGLYRVGTLSEALQALPLPDSSLRVALRGLRRVRAVKLINRSGSFWAEIEELREAQSPEARSGLNDIETEALMRAALDAFGAIVQLNKSIPVEAIHSVMHQEQPGAVADAIAHHLPVRAPVKQELLEEFDPSARLERVLALLKREQQILELDSSIRQKVSDELEGSQREFYLREQLKVIQTELQSREERAGETEEYLQKIEAAAMPEAALEKAMTELRRLDRMPASSPEGIVVRNYLDCLVSLPWSALTEDRLDVNAAEALLDRRHYGLNKVKERVLDYLAVRQIKGSLRGPILCFVGPPGVGKTSIGRSIAEAMGRKVSRISLGGVRDEAEIRGHRQTYIGALPGRLIQAVRLCGSRNPVLILDEIDKFGFENRGDPTAALLEALDPEQNSKFSDHYVETPFDLSAVMFIATANVMENIPAAMRDRMEVIPFPSYTDDERCNIATTFLIPKAIEEHGLVPDQLVLTDSIVKTIVTDYTREAGVRALDRAIAALCRKAARRIASGDRGKMKVTESTLAEMLGRPSYSRLEAETAERVGAAAGLVVSELGGDVIEIEVSLMEPLGERPELTLTGNLGAVMKESAQAALTYVRAHAAELGAVIGVRQDVHLHVPEGAVPKDGPSAGVPIAAAMASALTGRAVRAGVAMTGELTLRGRILPVGGIRDKTLAAARAGFTTLILPALNVPDLEDVPKAVRDTLIVHGIEDLGEALKLALV